MSPNEIRAELVRRGIQRQAIAAQLGIANAGVSQVISGVKKTPRVRAAIAAAIGQPVEEVFPTLISQEAA